MPRPPVRIVYKEEEEEYKDISAKDLTKTELIKYIFSDFVRGFYIVGCLFLDFLVLPQIYGVIPFSKEIGQFSSAYLGGINLYGFYLDIVIVVLEIFFIWLEIKVYFKYFRKKTVNKEEKETDEE